MIADFYADEIEAGFQRGLRAQRTETPRPDISAATAASLGLVRWQCATCTKVALHAPLEPPPMCHDCIFGSVLPAPAGVVLQ